jgi:succinyl-diaminopimelate desuccinylase
MQNDNDLAARLTALTRDLVMIRSTDARPDERERCFQLISNHLDALDRVAIRRYESNGYGSMVVAPKDDPSPAIVLVAHLDVVEHPDLATYGSSIRDGRICGPGAGDMKGSLAIILELYRNLHQRSPGLSLGLAVTSDEECGGEDGLRYLFSDVGLRCGQAIMPDGGSLARLTVEEKGIIHVHVTCRGEAAHAARPWQGVNALHRLIDRLTALVRHFDQYATGDPDESGEYWRPTCSVTILHSDNESINRIPEKAVAGLDVRFTPPHHTEDMLDEIRRVLGPDCEIEVVVSSEPTHLAPDDLFCQVTEDITGQPVTRARASGGSDARFMADFGIPVNLSQPIVGNIHNPDEWIDIASMVSYYQICEEYIRKKLG